MKYITHKITFSEVPNEISLTLLISGCPLRCKGCHSDAAWQVQGIELTNENFIKLLHKNEFMITTVCFLGGEWEPETLINLLITSREMGFKTCLYTGLTKVDNSIKNHLDYLKVGRWIAELGGLTSPRTNQRFYDLNADQDLTHVFFKE